MERKNITADGSPRVTYERLEDARTMTNLLSNFLAETQIQAKLAAQLGLADGSPAMNKLRSAVKMTAEHLIIATEEFFRLHSDGCDNPYCHVNEELFNLVIEELNDVLESIEREERQEKVDDPISQLVDRFRDGMNESIPVVELKRGRDGSLNLQDLFDAGFRSEQGAGEQREIEPPEASAGTGFYC